MTQVLAVLVSMSVFAGIALGVWVVLDGWRRRGM